MDAAKRWETEAMRESRARQRRRPAVSQDRKVGARVAEWRTLREAAEITGIPIGTLRKWCRRETVDSYLESDGELTLRMVEMGSVRARADALGREQPDVAAAADPAAAPAAERTRRSIPAAAPETMIVPVDAWNKMLNQLGNLHEAGQQLAEARERAAKAETEAVFLRERLAEMREDAGRPSTATDSAGTKTVSSAAGSSIDATADPTDRPEPDGDSQRLRSAPTADSATRDETTDAEPESVAFWRYVVRGWRGRRS